MWRTGVSVFVNSSPISIGKQLRGVIKVKSKNSVVAAFGLMAGIMVSSNGLAATATGAITKLSICVDNGAYIYAVTVASKTFHNYVDAGTASESAFRKNLYATLLSAYQTGKSITIVGTGGNRASVCGDSVSPASEEINKVVQ